MTFPEVLSQFPRLVFSSSKRMIPAVELVEAYCKTVQWRSEIKMGKASIERLEEVIEQAMNLSI